MRTVHQGTTALQQQHRPPGAQDKTNLPLQKSAELHKFMFSFQLISTTKGAEIKSAPKLNGNGIHILEEAGKFQGHRILLHCLFCFQPAHIPVYLNVTHIPPA